MPPSAGSSTVADPDPPVPPERGPEPPSTIQVGPLRYTVVHDHLGLVTEAGNAGHCRWERQIIALDAGAPHDAKAVVVLHEVIHACLAALAVDDDTEEAVTRHLGHSLLGVLRANPTLVTYLTG